MICQKCKKRKGVIIIEKLVYCGECGVEKYGINNRDRRVVSSSKINKKDDGTYQVIKPSRLLWTL